MHPLLAAALSTQLIRERTAATRSTPPGRDARGTPGAAARADAGRRRHPHAPRPPTPPALVRLGALDGNRSAGQLLADAAADHAVLVAEVDGSHRGRARARRRARHRRPVPPQRAGSPAALACAPASSAVTRRAAAATASACCTRARRNVSGRCCRPARPPRPPSRPGSGWRGPTVLLRRSAARFGVPFTLRTAWTDAPMVVVSDPADVRTVFTASPDVLTAGESSSFLEPFVGPNSILILDGPPHLRQRKLMLPPFHGDRMRAHRDLIARARGGGGRALAARQPRSPPTRACRRSRST